jgi:uncharacterized protein involved in cysteine biosynthesis
MSSLVIPMKKGVMATYLRGVVGENAAFQCLFWFTFWLLTISFSGYHFNRSSLSFAFSLMLLFMFLGYFRYLRVLQVIQGCSFRPTT